MLSGTLSVSHKEILQDKTNQERGIETLANDPKGWRIAEYLIKVLPDIDSQAITAVVCRARELEELKRNIERAQSSFFRFLTEPAKQAFSGLTGMLSSTMNLLSSAAGSGLAESKSVAETASDTQLARECLGNLEKHITAACNTAQNGIILNAGINIREVYSEEGAATVHARPSMLMCQVVAGSADISGAPKISQTSIIFPSSQWARFRYATNSTDDRKPLLVETFSYQPEDGSVDPHPFVIDRVKRLTAQLSLPAKIIPHVLHCSGYFQDPVRNEIGLVFTLEQQVSTNRAPLSLKELYTEWTHPPLGDRLRIAYSLASAMTGLHRVGWVHKAIHSRNLLFLGKSVQAQSTPSSSALPGPPGASPIPDVDLTSPYLFGFDSSRPDDAATMLAVDNSLDNNVYRHPARWNQPVLKFEKPHDIYSLVSISRSSISCETGNL